jgi:hypothetical protein
MHMIVDMLYTIPRKVAGKRYIRNVPEYVNQYMDSFLDVARGNIYSELAKGNVALHA